MRFYKSQVPPPIWGPHANVHVPAVCTFDLFYLQGENKFESLPQIQHPEQSVLEQRPPGTSVESPGLVLSRAPQHNLVPAAVNSICTYQAFNLRLSETDPSSKSIMQFTESIFHLVLHVWGEPSFWELQSGVFLPFWLFGLYFVWLVFFPFLSQMINVSHWLFFLLLWWFDWLCKAKMSPVPCGSIWRPLLIQLTLN